MKKILFLLMFLGVFSACDKNQKACKDAICTEEVRSIDLILRTALGVIPPSVDYCETFLNGRLLNTDVGQVTGGVKLVHILDDSHRNQFALNQAQTVTVRITQLGVVSKETTFSILADCCHINRLTGPDTLVVQ